MDAAQELFARASNAEPDITRNLQKIGGSLGAELVGLDYRLKSVDSMARKIAQDAERSAVTLGDAAAAIRDTLRYTYQFDPTSYGEGVWRATQAMIDAGYSPVRFKDFWTQAHTGYAGINTLWKTADEQYFEVQFTTEAALHAKEMLSHPLYERLRELDQTAEEAIAIGREIDRAWENVRATPPSMTGLDEARQLYP